MRTVSLIGKPSFLRGMARVLNIGGSLSRGTRTASATPTDDDLEALAADWQAVMGDMGEAFRATANHVAQAGRYAQAQE